VWEGVYSGVFGDVVICPELKRNVVMQNQGQDLAASCIFKSFWGERESALGTCTMYL
jgi:hypothetical protein